MSNVIVPLKFMLDTKISDGAKVLYSILLGKAQANYTVRITQKDLADMMEISERTVRRGVGELISIGLLVINGGYKKVNEYLLLPYEWKGSKFDIETEIDYNNLIYKVKEYYERVAVEEKKSKKRNTKVQTPQDIINEIDGKISRDEELTVGDYGKYFFKVLYEKKGLLADFRGVKQNIALKKLVSGRERDEALNIIDTYIDIYDDKFKKPGFEVPKIEGLGTVWILNIVVDLARNRIRRRVANENDLDYDNAF